MASGRVFFIGTFSAFLLATAARADSADDFITQKSPSQQHMAVVNQQLDQVQADVAQGRPILQAPPKKSDWQFEIAPEYSHIKYHEEVNASDFVRELGNMVGVSGIFTYHPPVGNFLNNEILNVYRAEGRFSYGKVNYKGAIQYSDGSVVPESFNGIKDYMVELRSLAGKEYYFNNHATRVTPYIGLGYRSLYDAFSANKPYGYDRRIQYLYAPVGAEVMTRLTDGWSIAVQAEYDVFIRGFVTSYFKALGFGNLTNTQTSGYGLRGSVKLIKDMNHYDYFVEPYVRFWSIHDSRITDSSPFDCGGSVCYVLEGEEPNNKSLEVGTKLGIDF